MNQASKRPKLWDIRRLPQDIGRLICFWMPLFFRLKRLRPDGTNYNETLREGGILVSNHTGMLDPLLVGTTFWYRRVFFLTAKEVMKSPVIALLCRGIGCIRIDRESTDLEAIKQSVSILKEGRLLTVFAQGGIGAHMEQIKSGAVLLALQAGVPLIPVYIGKRTRWYRSRPVVIGNTIDPTTLCTKKVPSVKDIGHITEVLFEELRRCQAYEEERTV